MAFPQRHPTAASAARKRMASASQRATLLRSSADREADDLQNFLKSPHRTGRRLRSSRLRLERRIDGTPSNKHLRPRTGDRTHAIASMVRARGRGRRGFGEIEMRVVRGHRSGGRRDGAVTYLGVWWDVGICGRGRLDGLLAACSGSRSPKRCRESRTPLRCLYAVCNFCIPGGHGEDLRQSLSSRVSVLLLGCAVEARRLLPSLVARREAHG